MLSGNYFKKPRNTSEDVMSFVKTSVTDVNSENWDKAATDIGNLEKAWKNILPRIQFSVERDEIYNIGVNIAKLKAAAIVEDKSLALTELYEVMENWEELTR
jgi:translation elongation factor EF-1beta